MARKHYAFEGADGTGKSTLMNYTAEILQEIREIRKIQVAREPEEPFRDILFNKTITPTQEVLLFFADRHKKVYDTIYNIDIDDYADLDYVDPQIFISDRSWLSTIIYQYLYKQSVDLQTLNELFRYIDYEEYDKIFVVVSPERYKGDAEDNQDRDVVFDKINNYYEILSTNNKFKESLLNEFKEYEHLSKIATQIERNTVFIYNENRRKSLKEIMKNINLPIRRDLYEEKTKILDRVMAYEEENNNLSYPDNSS